MKLKILHVCLASHYTEGMTYQDNQLADQNASDGHEVVVISDCLRYSGHLLEPVEEEDVILASGVRLIRMKYDHVVSRVVSKKVRKVSRLKFFLDEFKPDVILFHGVAGYEMLTVASYKRDNPDVKLYVDSHEDYHNSGTFWFSLFFQYKVFNRWIVHKIRNDVDKFLYLSYESEKFLKEIYGLDENELEFYPLGGSIIDPDKKALFKVEVRNELKLRDEDIIIVHSGKLAKEKRTQELLEAFALVSDERLNLVLIGSIPEEMTSVLQPLIDSDDRISYLGWKKSDSLIKYLAAADIYVQPGTQSATMQNAICCGTPVALYPYESHRPYVNGNGFYIKNGVDYSSLFKELGSKNFDFQEMIVASYKIARELLDYKQLASRLYR